MENKKIMQYVSKSFLGREYITVYNDQIIYEKNNLRISSKEEPSKSCKIEIKDKDFIESIILENLYMPIKKQLSEKYNEVKSLSRVTRPKNTARQDLLIDDNDFTANIDMYIEEYGDIYNQLILPIKNAILSYVEKS